MENNWFENVFLKSLLEKMCDNEKYPNSVLLSYKQHEVCIRNMQHKQVHTDYGWTGHLEYHIDGFVFYERTRGKYYILSFERTRTEKQEYDAKQIRLQIELLEQKLDQLYENKEDNLFEIESLENKVDSLWDLYNETLKVK